MRPDPDSVLTPAPQRGAGLEDWLRWQERLHVRPIDLGLSRVAEVADRLGLRDAPARTLTIGGTNGKGSSAHLAAQVFALSGYRVGLYTSPHLLRYNERVRIDGREAADDDLVRAFRAIDGAREQTSLTYFEFGTLAALWLFREAGVDVQVLEVGLGGRLDAVNIIDADTAIVTNIGLDHTDWLGSDRDAIGHEKAGIFRGGRPAIVVDRDPPPRLLADARAIDADLRRIGIDFDMTVRDTVFDWQGRTLRLRGLPLPVGSAARLLNAAGVIAAIEAMAPGLRVDEAALRQALQGSPPPGRCETRGRLLLDVGHNLEAAECLVAHLRSLPPARPQVLLLGMLSDKPVEAVFGALRPLCDALVLCGLPGARGQTAEALRSRLPADVDAQCCDNADDALRRARALAGPAGRIVVTGSFLTVAAVLNAIDG